MPAMVANKWLQWIGKMTAAGLLLACGQAAAQRLPSMSEPPWTGFFSGTQQRNFEFGINDEGAMELYLMSRKKERVGYSRRLRIYPHVVVENGEGKQFYKKLKEDEGFATKMKPGMDHEEAFFTAETKEGAKVEVVVKYERNAVVLDGKVLDRGKLGAGKVFFAYKVAVPSMYYSSYKNAEKAKARMRKDKFRFVRAVDGKRVTLKTYEKVKLLDAKNAKGGVRELLVDMDGQEGHKLHFATADQKGVLQIKHPRGKTGSMLWQGYEVLWMRPLEQGKDAIKPLVIEIK